MGSTRSDLIDVVDVIVDLVARPGPFTYRAGGAELVGIGDEVRVPLGARVVEGWVVDVRREAPRQTLRPILARRRPGPPLEATRAALLAARWALASPPLVLRYLRRPRVRGAPELPSQVGRLDDRLVDLSAVPIEVYLVPLETSAPAETVRLLAVGALGRRVTILAPTEPMRGAMFEHARARGLRVARMPHDWDTLAGGAADVAIGGRRAAFAPLAGVDTVVVVDPVHPGARQEATPFLEAYDLARARAVASGARLVVVSAAPPVEVLDRARLHVPTRRLRSSVPALRVHDLFSLDPLRSVEGVVADAIEAERRRAPAARALVVVPHEGLGRQPTCRRCGAGLSCVRCGESLRVLPARRGVPERGWCPRCARAHPLRCGACGSRAVAVSRWSVEHVRQRLEVVLREPVAAAPSPSTRVEVGTIEQLNEEEPCEVVVLVEPERFFGAHGRLSGELALYWIHRALVRARARVDLVVASAPAWLSDVVATRTVKPALRAIHAERHALGLDQWGGTALVSGPEAAAFVHALVEGAPGTVEVGELGAGRFLLRASSPLALRQSLLRIPRPLDARRLRLELAPREL